MVSLVLLVFILFIMSVFIVGDASKYITPSMNVPLMISAVFLIIMFAFNVPSKEDEENFDKKINLSNVFYLLPIIMLIIASNTQLSGAIAGNKMIDIGVNESGASEVISDLPEDLESSLKNSETMITIDDKNFSDVLMEVSNNVKKYVGRQIKVSGFIFNAPGLEQDQFVIARLRMSCCAADSSIVGFVSKREGKYKNDDWYEIEGTLSVEKYKGDTDIPMINVEKIEKIARPKKDKWYVY
jgi:putative membrane protein